LRQVDLCASLTGVVWEVRVREGEKVLPGDDLVILESMKMEIPHATDLAGTVAQVLVKKGDFVNEGQVLVVLQG